MTVTHIENVSNGVPPQTTETAEALLKKKEEENQQRLHAEAQQNAEAQQRLDAEKQKHEISAEATVEQVDAKLTAIKAQVEAWAITEADAERLTKEVMASQKPKEQWIVDQALTGVSNTAENIADTMGIRDKTTDKWNLKNTAMRVGGAIGLTWLRNNRPSRLWGKSKVEKKKWFRNHGVGKLLKWAGIGVGWFLGIKRLMDYFGSDKDPDLVQKPTETINNNYDKLLRENPDRAKEAEKIGNNINEFWSKTIFQNTDGRQDNDMLWEEHGKDFVFDTQPGAIIANMDAQYSVGDMLDKDDYLMNTVQHAINKPYYAIMERWEEKIGAVLKPLSWFVEGIKSTFRSSDGKLTEEGKTELAKPNATRDAQLYNIFGKYMRVKLWYQTKIQQLREKFAKDALNETASSWDIEDYLEDESHRTAIDLKIKTEFLDKKPIDAAKFVEEQGIPNDSLPENMQEVITDINDEYHTYHHEAFTKVINNKESIESHKPELTQSCDAFIGKLSEPAVTRNMCEWVCHAMGLDILANTQWADIDAIAQQMGFSDLIKWYQSEASEISMKLTNNTATAEDIEHLHKLMESFRMLQIEITLGGIVKNTSDQDGTITSKMMTRAWERALSYLVNEDGSINFKTIAFVWWAYLLRKPIIRAAKPLASATRKSVKFAVNAPTKIGAVRGALNRLPQWTRLRSRKYMGPNALSRFNTDLTKGNISLKQAKEIRDTYANQGKRLWQHTISFEDNVKSLFPWKKYAEIEEILTKKVNLDLIAPKLRWDSKKLFTKAQNEIKALERELEQAKVYNIAGKSRLTQEVKAMEDLAVKISKATSTEATALLKATENLSIKSLAYLTKNFKDPSKITALLDDITKGTESITHTALHTKLMSAGEEEAAKLFKTESSFTKAFVQEVTHLRSEITAGRQLISHLDEGIKVLGKILSKIR